MISFVIQSFTVNGFVVESQVLLFLCYVLCKVLGFSLINYVIPRFFSWFSVRLLELLALFTSFDFLDYSVIDLGGKRPIFFKRFLLFLKIVIYGLICCLKVFDFILAVRVYVVNGFNKANCLFQAVIRNRRFILSWLFFCSCCL